ncbi:MAG: transketolase [Chlamydiae bacterium]|nr:transketolase [Chlamydiota bacterium]
MDKEILKQVANTVRGLSIDGVQKANSGHPGLPMGCASLGAYLYGEHLRYNSKDPSWINRDIMVLSAGHGSMWLYSLLHLSGYNVSLDDLMQFRQLNSKTPGHPEKLDTEGVEVTTGPLGQGVANAVGFALAYSMLAKKFNRPGYEIFNNKVYALAGDGCLMEGVSNEACALAGHLELKNLVLFYDRNWVTLDDFYKASASENVAMRYQAMGWEVCEISQFNNFDEIHSTLTKLKGYQAKPILCIYDSTIGYGSPNKQGTNKSHGSPLGPDEVKLAKEYLGIPLEPPFYVPDEVKKFFKNRGEKLSVDYHKWQDQFNDWKKQYPELAKELEAMHKQEVPTALVDALEQMAIKTPCAGRAASHDVIQVLAKHIPSFLTGSADLSESDKTHLSDYPTVTHDSMEGRNIKFGVREHGMAAIANGMAATGFFQPTIGTFFCFSDYMRPAVRLAALSHLPVRFVWTHDSIGLGEDGPTHQAVEQLASLRAMPNFYLFRPGDEKEVRHAWRYAVGHRTAPVGMVLSRQNMPKIALCTKSYEEGVSRGAYVLLEEKKDCPIDFTLFATGTELSLAVDVAEKLKSMHKNVRVVSVPCFRLFHEQPQSYKQKVIGGNLGVRAAIEAGSSFGWAEFVGLDGHYFTVDTFGKSAPLKDVYNHFGLTVENIVNQLTKSRSCTC